jgi:hypothetical protein
MKAVVWTDCFQVMILYSSMFAVLVKGTIDIGGLATVWERNSQSGRSDFFKYVVLISNQITILTGLTKWMYRCNSGVYHHYLENPVCTVQGRGIHVTGVSAAYTFKLNKNILSE